MRFLNLNAIPISINVASIAIPEAVILALSVGRSAWRITHPIRNNPVNATGVFFSRVEIAFMMMYLTGKYKEPLT